MHTTKNTRCQVILLFKDVPLTSPTKEEWKAFYSTVYDNPALVNTIGYAQWSEGDAFTSVQSSHYWSSTEIDDLRAWFVDMDSGKMHDMGYKYFNMYVWPVRSGND